MNIEECSADTPSTQQASPICSDLNVLELSIGAKVIWLELLTLDS